MGAALILLCIWLLALALASPIALFRRLAHSNINLHAFDIHDVVYCVEDWPMQHGRAYYSAFSLFIQYLLPIMIVSAAYTSIYSKLRSRIQIGGTATTSLTTTTATTTNQHMQSNVVDDAQRERKLQRSRRMRRTNCLLCSIAVIFGVSWLPLNLYNLFADVFMTGVAPTQPMLIAYAVCHMMGMSSACSNPFMYGWLNDNFRKEFREILCMDTHAVCVVTEHTHARGGGGGGCGGEGGGGGGGERRSAAATTAKVALAASAKHIAGGGGDQQQMAMQLLKCEVTQVSVSGSGEATSSMANGSSGGCGGGGGASSPRHQTDATELTVLVQQ